ncbi:MAG: sialidase family protein [Kiritimatiellia bacterium]
MKQTHAPSLSRAGTPAPLLLTALLALAGGTAAAIDEHAVYVSGQGGYHTYRIPALARTNAGTLLAFCEGRRNSSSDTGDIDLLVRRSADGGVTWGPPIVVWNDGANTCGNPAPVVDTATGTIHLLSTWNLGTDAEGKIIIGVSTDTRRVFVLTSTDTTA